jgi:hypothetical protein
VVYVLAQMASQVTSPEAMCCSRLLQQQSAASQDAVLSAAALMSPGLHLARPCQLGRFRETLAYVDAVVVPPSGHLLLSADAAHYGCYVGCG